MLYAWQIHAICMQVNAICLAGTCHMHAGTCHMHGRYMLHTCRCMLYAWQVHAICMQVHAIGYMPYAWQVHAICVAGTCYTYASQQLHQPRACCSCTRHASLSSIACIMQLLALPVSVSYNRCAIVASCSYFDCRKHAAASATSASGCSSSRMYQLNIASAT